MLKKVVIIKIIVGYIGLYSALFFVLSCKKEVDEEKISPIKETIIEETIEDTEVNSATEFPKTGNKISDFVISPYEIQYQAEGLLDNDALEDFVIVLQNKNDRTSSRPTLVLLKQTNGDYRLQEISWVAIEPDFTVEDYKMYNTENISISKNKLFFSLDGIGAAGNKETIYKFVEKRLVLINVHTYHAGAGGQEIMDYNLISGKITLEDVNTMIDSMPSIITIKYLKFKNKIFFEKDDPEKVLDSIFKIM